MFGQTSNLFGSADMKATFSSFKAMAESTLSEISTAAKDALDAGGGNEDAMMFASEGGITLSSTSNSVPNTSALKKEVAGTIVQNNETAAAAHAKQSFDEELVRMKLQLQSKDTDFEQQTHELHETKEMLRLAQLAEVNMKKETKEMKVMVTSLEANVKRMETENITLRENVNQYQKLAEDRLNELNVLQKQLTTAQSFKKQAKAAKAAESDLKDTYEDKISTMEREMSDLREELQNTVEDRTSIVTSLQKQLAEVTGKMTEVAGSHDTNVTTTTTTTTTHEVSQYLEQLKQAKDHVSTLEKKLEKTKNLQRKFEDQLKVKERERQALEDETKNAAIEASNESSALKDRVTGLESELTIMKTATSAMQEKYITEREEKVAQMDELTKTLSKVQEDFDEEKLHCLNAKQEVKTMMIRVEEAESEVAKLKKSNESMQEVQGGALIMTTKTDELTLALKKSEDALAAEKTQSSTLQTKLTHVAEKLKDVMRRYAEAKASLKCLEQDKESEFMSLRLKLENAERGTGDQRAMASELAERYGDVQRELSRTKTSIQGHLLTIENLQTDKKETEEKFADMNEKYTNALEQVRIAAEARKDHERRVRDLLEERERMEDKLRSDEDSAKVLDEYKKRAQLALKNANSASASAAAEVAELKRAKDEAYARANQAEESLLISEERCTSLQNELEKVLIQASQLKNDHATAVAAEKTALAAAESTLAQLIDTKEALAEVIRKTAEIRIPTAVIETMSTFDPDIEEKTKDHIDAADVAIPSDRKRIGADVSNVQPQNDSSLASENSTTLPSDDAIVSEMKRHEYDEDDDRDVHEQRRAKNRSLRRTLPSGEHPSSDKLMLVNEVTKYNHPSFIPHPASLVPHSTLHHKSYTPSHNLD